MHPIIETIAQPNFGKFVLGNGVSLIGTWMQRIAVGWLAWQLTGSATWLGVIAMADLLPSLFIGPIGGVIADRYSRLKILQLMQVFSFVQSGILWALASSGWITIELLVLLTFVNGVIIGFAQPSRLSLVPNLIGEKRLSTGISINSITFNLARFLGPAVAGVIIHYYSVSTAIGVNVFTYLVFYLLLTQIKIEGEAESHIHRERGSILGDIIQAVRYVAKHVAIGPIIVLIFAGAMGVRSFVELMPGYAADVFMGGAEMLAMMTSAVGIGAVFAGLWMSSRPEGTNLAKYSLYGSVAMGLFIMGFVSTDVYWVGLIFAVLVGGTVTTTGISNQTVINLTAPPDMRGRILSLYGMLFRSGPAIGALIIGMISEVYGLRLPQAGGGVLTLLACVWFWSRREQIYAAAMVRRGAGKVDADPVEQKGPAKDA